MGLPALALLSYEDYLRLEQETDVKHEFLDGEVLAMSGGTPSHADLITNTLVQLSIALAGRPCRPSNSDQKLRVLSSGFAFYPDVSVICGPRIPHPEDKNTFTNPTVLVEVLSPSTEARDRGQKFALVQAIPSLQEYVLVNTRLARVEVFRRNADPTWTLRVYGPGETVELASIEVNLAVDELYARVELPPATLA